MLDELTKTIKAQLYERASSPLLSSFALSWVAWNYRFILVLLSSMPAAEKMAFIDANIFPSYQDILVRGGLYPLLTALSLIFIYPIPAKYVYEYWRTRQRELKAIQQRIDDETPLTKEEARVLRRETIKVTTEYERELERKSTEIARLRELVTELERASSPPKERKQRKSGITQSLPEEPLDEAQMQMLEKIAGAKSDAGITVKKVIASSGKDKLLSEFNLGELERRGLVSRSFSSELADYAVKVTHLGRAHLVNSQRNKLSSADDRVELQHKA